MPGRLRIGCAGSDSFRAFKFEAAAPLENMDQRRAMMATWADDLDRLRDSAKVISIKLKTAG